MPLIKCLIFCFVLALPLAAACQDKRQLDKVSFHPIFQLGLLNGSNGASANLQAIAGVNFKPLYVGLGAGIDYYRFRSVPLFASFRKDLGKLRKPAFLYADLGYNFDWLTSTNLSENWYGGEYKGGRYYDLGIGGRFNRKSLAGLTVSAGYSGKVLKQDVLTSFCPLIGPCISNTDVYRYTLARIVVKIGWIF